MIWGGDMYPDSPNCDCCGRNLRWDCRCDEKILGVDADGWGDFDLPEDNSRARHLIQEIEGVTR